jgi:RNA polymerase sigma-70 factor (ECF subfamily)
MESQSLRAVIAAAQTGKAWGFERLLELYSKRLYGYFLRATASHHDAEDLLSDLTLRLVRTLKHYDHRGRFEPWLFRVAANMVRDRIRRHKAHPPLISLSGQSTNNRTPGEQVADGQGEVDAGLIAEEARGELNEVLERLNDTTREMILLRYFGELTFKELAELFDCPIGTVLARVHRGLKTLRETIGTK